MSNRWAEKTYSTMGLDIIPEMQGNIVNPDLSEQITQIDIGKTVAIASMMATKILIVIVPFFIFLSSRE